ncbi:MAG: ABC transporter ATP-binding protein [Acidobacteriota bacterium]
MADHAPLEHLRLQALWKSFGDVDAVRGIDLSVSRGEFLTLLGPSGCGKTTTLRMVAGFEPPTSGTILLHGKDITNEPPNSRPINTVFQHYALFPHLSVEENIAFGLRMRGVPATERQRQVTDALRAVALPGFERRHPRQLSGGQQQRVALARALVNRPEILLLDEPLGALDLKLRRQMQLELRALHREVGISFLYVTHDQEEALAMSDRVAVMNAGRIEQIGSPREIYEQPISRFVADFIGETNLLEGRVVRVDGTRVQVKLGPHILHALGEGCVTGTQVALSIRPERWTLTEGVRDADMNRFSGRVRESVYAGSVLRQVVELEGGITVVATRPGNLAGEPAGSAVTLTIIPSDVVVLPAGPPDPPA